MRYGGEYGGACAKHTRWSEQRRVLGLLATNLYGMTEDQLALADGFGRDMIAGLVDDGLVRTQREGRTTIEVVCIKISDADRRALEG